MMNQQDIFRKIGNILSELNEQYEFLAQNPKQLNGLELELFLANASFLSDHVQIVKKLSEQNPQEPVKAIEPQTPVANILPLPQNNKVEEETDPIQLEEIVKAEEEEERVDLQTQLELQNDEQHKEEIAEEVLNKDFFKPDQDDYTFEFDLGNHSEHDQFDYEAKPVEEIFDRKLSEAEEEILAQKKRIHEKQETETASGTAQVTEEDEIGPEPFLIPHETEMAMVVMEEEEDEEEPETPVAEQNTPVAPLKTISFDDAIISPKVDDRPVFTPQAVPVKPVEKPISSNPAPTLNDLLAKTNAQPQEVKAPIGDLKQAINLNEKLLFIRELFNGYNLAYSEVIDIINKMESFETADTFLQKNYAVKNNWASKQNTVDQFYELLNRRFSK
ncbi:hypothetical protein ACJVDH_14125 [Pedobacter sp. AW1-32]|uniref:hypothetical protein n=1 Tax=Pedobacter sp. AW1-32 TaxID=3383026 RepID=UPI003FED6C48